MYSVLCQVDPFIFLPKSFFACTKRRFSKRLSWLIKLLGSAPEDLKWPQLSNIWRARAERERYRVLFVAVAVCPLLVRWGSKNQTIPDCSRHKANLNSFILRNFGRLICSIYARNLASNTDLCSSTLYRNKSLTLDGIDFCIICDSIFFLNEFSAFTIRGTKWKKQSCVICITKIWLFVARSFLKA